MSQSGKSVVLILVEKPIYSMLAIGSKIYTGASPTIEVWSASVRTTRLVSVGN